jgi:arabinogalactan oligomer/maltooligosaccharide transport system permease protein
VFAAIAFAIAFAMSWCPSAAAAPIKIWHAYRGEEERALLESIAEAPQADVVVLAIPYDAFSAKLASAIPFGEGPDLFVDSHERIGEYARRGFVGPVGDALEQGAYVDVALTAVSHDGELLAVPLSLKSLALYVNDDLVDAVPTDLEGIVELAPTLPAGVYAFAYEAQNTYAHAPILHAFGGRMLDDRDGFAFVGPAAEQSLSFVANLLDVGAVPRDADGALVTNLFRAGKAAFAMSGPWLAADLGDSIRYHVEPLPLLRATGERLRPMLTVESIMFSPTGAGRPEVRALARHLAGARAAELRMRLGRAVSARGDVDASGDPLMRAFAEQAALAVPMPSSPAMRSTWEPAHKALRKVLRGEADPPTALAEAQRRFDEIRRPPPPPASPAPALVLLGIALVLGAWALVRRVRSPTFRQSVRRSLPAWAYVAHAVVAVGVLVVAPLLVGAVTSLFAGPSGEQHYVGLANFIDILRARGGPLFASGSFWLVLLVTLLWTAINVVFHLGIGVALGLVLACPVLRMRALYRVLLIIPWAVPNYVTAIAWKGMFHRQFGAVTGLIHATNDVLGTDLQPISWFAKFSTAFAANVATNVWLGFPFMMVVTVAALTSVPKDVLEAAEVDGATGWQRLWHVTLPMIRPSMLPAITLGAIWTFNMFNVVFLVSGGDPDGTTDILVSEAYRWAFTREAQYGYAAAYAVLIFVLLSIGTRLLQGRGSAEGRR